jgi:translation initiation factor 2 subunit 2
MDYDKMLDRLYISLPKNVLNKERFEMPRTESAVQGKKTIIKNFSQIAKTINRDEKHIFKFFTKETAAAGTIADGKLVLSGKFSFRQIQELFESYLKHYVLCLECKKPDTVFIEHNGIKMLKCEACGAVSPIKRL